MFNAGACVVAEHNRATSLVLCGRLMLGLKQQLHYSQKPESFSSETQEEKTSRRPLQHFLLAKRKAPSLSFPTLQVGIAPRAPPRTALPQVEPGVSPQGGHTMGPPATERGHPTAQAQSKLSPDSSWILEEGRWGKHLQSRCASSFPPELPAHPLTKHAASHPGHWRRSITRCGLQLGSPCPLCHVLGGPCRLEGAHGSTRTVLGNSAPCFGRENPPQVPVSTSREQSPQFHSPLGALLVAVLFNHAQCNSGDLSEKGGR